MVSARCPCYYVWVVLLLWLAFGDSRSIGSSACSYGSTSSLSSPTDDTDDEATHSPPWQDMEETHSCGSVNGAEIGNAAVTDAVLNKSLQTETLKADSSHTTEGDSTGITTMIQIALNMLEDTPHMDADECGRSCKTKGAMGTAGHQTSTEVLTSGELETNAAANSECTTTSGTESTNSGEVASCDMHNEDALDESVSSGTAEGKTNDRFFLVGTENSAENSFSTVETDETDSSVVAEDDAISESGGARTQGTEESPAAIALISASEDGETANSISSATSEVNNDCIESFSCSISARSPTVSSCGSLTGSPGEAQAAKQSVRLRGSPLVRRTSSLSASANLMKKVRDLVARGSPTKNLEKYLGKLEALKDIFEQRQSAWADLFSPKNYPKLLEQPADEGMDHVLRLCADLCHTRREIISTYGKAAASLAACKAAAESCGKRESQSEENLNRASAILSTIHRMIPQVASADCHSFSSRPSPSLGVDDVSIISSTMCHTDQQTSR